MPPNYTTIPLNKTLPLIIALLAVLALACSNREKPTVSLTEEGYLDGAGNARIYYNIWGGGSDTLVVIHGGPGAGINSVLPSVNPLARNHVLILYDQRGGGRSSLPADTTKLKPRYFVEDLEAVRRYFGLQKMNLVTHSFGSILAARYAQKYPDHLNRIVFHGATGPNLKQELRLRRARANQSPPTPDSLLSERASALLQKLLAGTASDPVEACREYESISRKLAMARGDTPTYLGTSCEAPPEAVRYYYRYTARLGPRYFGEWDFTSGLEKLETPLLVVYGKEDSLMIPAQRSWASAVPNGRLLLVPDAGKAAFSDNPGYVFPAVTTFFDGRWPEGAN